MGRTGRAVAVAVVIMASVSPAGAQDLTILSAGALEPAMIALADTFRRSAGHAVRTEFVTAAEIRQRGRAVVAAELVAAPEAVVAELAKANRLIGKPVPLGRIGLGIVMRAGSPAPDVSTAPALREALLAAKVVVYNRASSGQGIEALIKTLGLTDALKDRTVRFPDAESVMRHMMSEGSSAIGFGAPTAISLYTGPQLRYVGPVPPELQNYTSYSIAATVAATPLAQAFLSFLSGGDARAVIQKAGVEAR